MNAPLLTVTPNPDNVSLALAVAAFPAGATQVKVYRRTATGYDVLLGTLAAPGVLTDNNLGAGWDRLRVLYYVAQADDGAGTYSFPSREVMGQVASGTTKYTLAEHLEVVAILLENDPELATTLGYQVKRRVLDPTPFERTVYVLDGLESPDLRYASGQVEADLGLQLVVACQHGDAHEAWAVNDQAVERILRLVAINYRWNGRAWDTRIGQVNRKATVEGWQPQLAVATIPLNTVGQYAKFQPVP